MSRKRVFGVMISELSKTNAELEADFESEQKRVKGLFEIELFFFMGEEYIEMATTFQTRLTPDQLETMKNVRHLVREIVPKDNPLLHEKSLMKMMKILIDRVGHFNDEMKENVFVVLRNWCDLMQLYLVCYNEFSTLYKNLNASIDKINTAFLCKDGISENNRIHESLFDTIVDAPTWKLRQHFERLRPVYFHNEKFKPLYEDITVQVFDIETAHGFIPFQCVGFKHGSAPFFDPNYVHRHYSTTLLFIAESVAGCPHTPWLEITFFHVDHSQSIVGAYNFSSEFVLTRDESMFQISTPERHTFKVSGNNGLEIITFSILFHNPYNN